MLSCSRRTALAAAFKPNASPSSYLYSRASKLSTTALNSSPSTSTTSSSSPSTPPPSPPPHAQTSGQGPLTHYKITLQRSAISLGSKKQGTLKALGLHRRFQTVYYPHSPGVAGKILAVKELLSVENVDSASVRTREEMRVERKARRGYVVSGDKKALEL